MKLIAIVCRHDLCAERRSALCAQGRGNGQAKKTHVSDPKQRRRRSLRRLPKPRHESRRRRRAQGRNDNGKSRNARREGETKAAQKDGTTTATTTPTTEVTPTTPTTAHVKNPKLEARLLTMLPPAPTFRMRSRVQELGPVCRRRSRLEQSRVFRLPILKAKMTGITPGTTPGTTVPTTTPMSLGQAMQSSQGHSDDMTERRRPATLSTTIDRSEEGRRRRQLRICGGP